jgi:gliding motility-associated-like protein
MIFKYLKQTLSVLFLLPVLFFSTEVKSQCDVFIEPSSVNVIDNGSGVKFEFQITNNSGVDWYGDDLKLFWSLNSGVPIWNIDYTENTSSPPIADGETRTITTPWFDFPNLPSWFPEDPGPGGALDDNWVEAYEWPYWSVTPDGFDGTWSQFNLRLGSCGLADGAWVYNSDGTPYYGPFDSECPDVNGDALCDCDVDFIGFDPVTYDASIAVISHWNCGQPLNPGSLSSEMDNVNMIQISAHVPGWDYQWGCTSAQYHLGWTWDDPISYNEYYAGDTINYNLFSDDSSYDDCFQEILESDTLSSCLEIVLWQINYSQTYHMDDFPDGWATTCGVCNNQTQVYPDINMGMNSLNVCESPPPLYPGCTDPEAENYDETAGFDDGSCTYPPVLGCTNPTACNYDFNATQNDGSCVTCENTYEEGVAGCGQSTWESYINIFGCVDGCTDPDASNFNPDATTDDGSCEYLSPDASGKVNTINTLCVDGQPSNLVNIIVGNYNTGSFNATDTLFVYCVEVPELGLDSCLNGYLSGGSWIEPGGGQLIWSNVYIPDTIPQITVNVYYAEDEIEEYSFNNTFVYQNLFQDPDICEVLGCTDPEANNYDLEATQDDGSCTYDVIGCTDDTANNYNPDANVDDGSCTYDITELTYVGAECFVDCDVDGPYWYVVTTWTNTGNVEITNFCAEWDVTGGQGDDILCFNGSLLPGDTTTLQYGPYTLDVGLIAWAYVTEINGVTYNPPLENYETLYCFGEAQASCVYGCMDDTANNYNPDADFDDGSCTYDVFGCTDDTANNYNPDANIDDGSCTYDIYGCTDDTANNYNPDANVDDGSCEYDIFGCTDPEANNYDSSANVDDGSCTYDVYGCTDSEANNYNPDANVDDGSCTYDVYGCTDESANNYNPNANTDDGSCEYDVFGCTDESANNYNPDANVDDGSCTYDVYGCTDPIALNYNPNANIDDGSCNYIYGCTDPEADNYDSTATMDDGSCIYLGCTDPEANNYDPDATMDDGSCTYDVLGCTDPEANNYNPTANVDDGSCTYDVLGCTDVNAENYNPTANVDDGSCVYYGCTDPMATNFNPMATDDDGSCVYPGPCDGFDGMASAPNSFSPNNDGLNDVWRFLTNEECWMKWEVRIYNRWGQVVAVLNSPSHYWDGSFNGGDHYVSNGEYTYIVTAVSFNLQTLQDHGSILLLR